MDSVDKSAFYIYVFLRNILLWLGTDYSSIRKQNPQESKYLLSSSCTNNTVFSSKFY